MADFAIIKEFENYNKVKVNGKWGYYDKENNPVIFPNFEYVGDIQPEGYVTLKQNGRWGCVKVAKYGLLEVCAMEYEYIGSFKNGFAKVTVDGKDDFIDLNGDVIFEEGFDEVVKVLPNGYAIVRNYGLYGLYGLVNVKEGKQVLPCCYSKITLRGDKVIVQKEVVLA
ncbi:MAG: WG repeat-containing protein [Clostridia bacterium]|nr:WG repeat-containing protein [Clostridia bacterium]